MRYQQDLQVGLRERLRRLMTQGHSTYSHEVGLVIDWIEKQTLLRLILDSAQENSPDISVDSWLELCATNRRLTWPSGLSEEGRAALIWQFLQQVIDDSELPRRVGHVISSENNLDASVRFLTESLVAPLFDFLSEQVGTGSNVLYILERFKKRVEWFDLNKLYEQYLANTQSGELLYDRYLRRFLFDQGFNMPMAQVRSPSGQSDVLGDLDSDDPLVCEVKVFNGADHGKRVLASGVTQSVQYAKDFGQKHAYLVVVNLSGRVLELPSDGQAQHWPYLDVSGVRVHIVDVRALPVPSASKQGKVDPIHISRDELKGP